MPIDSVASLHAHLQLAIQVELTTIPLYLYAMYSLADPSEETTQLIRSVVTEEMLHATIVGNVMVATGGVPKFYDRDVVPAFPGELPHHKPPLPLSLTACSPELIRDVFLVIEAPAPVDAPPECDEYESLGQFYRAVEIALDELSAGSDLFGDPQGDRQISDPSFYGTVKFDSETSGSLFEINSLESAFEALEVVIHQGEGLGDERYADDEHEELTHYAKFLRIVEGECALGDVHPVPVDPTADRYPPEVADVARFFDAIYCYSLVLMDRLFTPMSHEDRADLIATLYGTMVALMKPVAMYLSTIDIGDGLVAAPTFDFYEFEDPDAAEAEIRLIGNRLLEHHPGLAPVVHQLERLPA